MKPAFLGLRTAVYRAPDLARARSWYTDVLGIAPYFDQPFYVGFNVGGYELGLDPDAPADAGAQAGAPSMGGVTVYWGVANAEASLMRLISLGATAHSDVRDVGVGDNQGIKVATVLDPFGNVFGIIENPHFTVDG
jgi:catechol 2,3-dioxygenase-like lactoylglutathione lyase family enzyme